MVTVRFASPVTTILRLPTPVLVSVVIVLAKLEESIVKVSNLLVPPASVIVRFAAPKLLRPTTRSSAVPASAASAKLRVTS